MMLVGDFDYDLPPELIAQEPLPERDASRMMLVNRVTQKFEDIKFADLPAVLRPGDLLVPNNTKVFSARLLGRRLGTKAQKIGRNNPRVGEFLRAEIELLLIRAEQPESDTWHALVRPGRKVRTGEVLAFGGGELEAEVLGRGAYGLRRVRLKAREGTVEDVVDRLGHVPLPPYIHRHDSPSDRRAYQTIYAKSRGSVAAPTAGFHFSDRVFSELRARGVETCEITLHIGLGTFQPVHVQEVDHHHMEPERFEICATTANSINRALDAGRRVVAVGSTSMRTIEHSALQNGGRIAAGTGETDLFIFPGFQFRVAGALLTNFHLPKSTLLMLASAFAGRNFLLAAYHHAVEQRYRFYSYGDCMLIV